MSANRDYNAATDFVDRNVAEGRGAKPAFIDDLAVLTYQELLNAAARVGPMLARLGVERENRIALVVNDCIEFPVLFWGAIRAGVIPVLLNTRLTSAHYGHLLRDSRAKAVFISPSIEETVLSGAREVGSPCTAVTVGEIPSSLPALASLLAIEKPGAAAATCADEVAYWLYSSGTTGDPKGVMHVHSTLRAEFDLCGRSRLGLRESDVVFSAAKMFFA